MVKFNSGSRGRAPVGVWGRSLPEAERFFFHFQKVIVALKRRKRPPSVEHFRGEGRPKRGDAAPALWIRHCSVPDCPLVKMALAGHSPIAKLGKRIIIHHTEKCATLLGRKGIITIFARMSGRGRRSAAALFI